MNENPTLGTTETSKTDKPAFACSALVREPVVTQRVVKEWWAVVDGGVMPVTGFSCGPSNPDMWWCPKVGLSMSEKHHLFENEPDAIRKAVAEAVREVVKWTEIVKKLNARLPND